VAAALQPPGERGTGDAGAVDEDAHGWGLAAIDGWRMRSSPVRACMRLAARELPRTSLRSVGGRNGMTSG
jgi:hypothetical protein